MQMEVKSRDTRIDLLRGFAMLMVVLGHTMTGCVSGIENITVFNIIWSLQMPLFMLISGYVNVWGKEISTTRDLRNYLKRRSLAYLMPALVWMIIVRGLLLGQREQLNIVHMLWHMDNGYWYLFSAWTICVVFGISRYLASRCTKRSGGVRELGFVTVLYFTGAIVLAMIAIGQGMDFFALKQTLYYMPFYFMGYLLSKVRMLSSQWNLYKKAKNIAVACCGIVYVVILTRFNLYTIADDMMGIFIRGMASLTGCVVFCELLCQHRKSRGSELVEWVGRHSLEMYLVHNLFLLRIGADSLQDIHTLSGIACVILNFAITVILSKCIINMLSNNMILRKWLFWKS